MKPDPLWSDSESIHYSLASALGTDQYARPIEIQSCNATQANKMPLKDRKAVGICSLLLLKAYIAEKKLVGEGKRLSRCARIQMIQCTVLKNGCLY